MTTNVVPILVPKLVEANRMSNRGGGAVHRLLLQVEDNPMPSSTRTYGAYWDRVFNHPWDLNTHPVGWEEAGAIAGNKAGVIVGFSDGNGAERLWPIYWSSPTVIQAHLTAVPGFETGQFWDVNGATPTTAVGLVTDANGGNQRAIRWSTSDFTYVFSPFDHPTGYTRSEARAVNDQGLVGGQVFGGPQGDTACVWTPAGQGYTAVLIDSSPDWAPVADRSAYVMGLTSAVAGDAAGPYAVGWVLPGNDPLTQPGQPFVWSLGTNRVKLCGTVYGVPTQCSDRAYSAGTPRVSFSGNTPLPYVWVGSPDPAQLNDGAALDAWAYLHPDVSQKFELPAQSPNATGIDQDFVFGGKGFVNVGNDQPGLWRTSVDETFGWQPTLAQSHELQFGEGFGGSLIDLAKLDGKFFTARRVGTPTPTTPRILIQAEGTSSWASPSDLALRTSVRKEQGGTFQMTTSFYNWDTATWHVVSSDTPAPYNTEFHWTTPSKRLTGAGPDMSPFVRDTDGRVRARVDVQKVGPSPVFQWGASFEQCQVLVRPPL